MPGPYVRVVAGQILTAGDNLPNQDYVLGTGTLVTDLPNATVAVRESCGWFAVDVTTNPRPVDTTSTTWASGFSLVDGRPVEQWTEVVKTAKQIETESRSVKAEALNTAARAAYARLNQIVAYVPPPITSNPIAQVELAKTMLAVQDISAILKEVVRLVLGSDMLDATKD